MYRDREEIDHRTVNERMIVIAMAKGLIHQSQSIGHRVWINLMAKDALTIK